MADKDQLDLILQGVESWNVWRSDNSFRNVDLSGADLRAINLDGVDLATLEGMSDVDLSGVNLSGANLSGANLRAVNLIGANLSGANLSGASISEASLGETNFSEADLSDANLDESALYKANLSKANLRGTHLYSAELLEANLSGADLSGTDLMGANLRKANLSGANFTDAGLEGVNFSEADLGGASFSGALLGSVNFEKANLSGTDLRGVRALTCEELRQAINWEEAIRDPELACGAEIPDPPDEGDEPDEDAAALIAALREDVAELKQRIDEFVTAAPKAGDLVTRETDDAPGMGHNNPPEPLPADEAEIIQDTVEGLRTKAVILGQLGEFIDTIRPSAVALGSFLARLRDARGPFGDAFKSELGKRAARILTTGGTIGAIIVGFDISLAEIFGFIIQQIKLLG
jgi:uncharacterized protein YjbI with pentapeptide repeats